MSSARPIGARGRLTEEEARELCSRAFVQCGVDPVAAAEAAEVLTLAEMMGITTHGLSRVVDYTTRMRAGGITAGAAPRIEPCAPALLRVDGQNALGPVTARCALKAGMDGARVAGIAGVFVRNGTHLGALAPYLLRATEQGFACIFTSNTAPMMAIPGGRMAMTGNMPLGIAVPCETGDPLLLDMAMTVVSRSRIRAAAQAGEPIPEGWALGRDGRPTTDPAEGLLGLIAPIGGDKGASLALTLDLFAGVLAGANVMDEIPDTHKSPETPPRLGYAIILVDCRKLMPAPALAARMTAVRDKVGAAPAADAEATLRLPGARALSSLRKAQADGFSPSPATLAKLKDLASG